jgi:hypothetical protein
MIQRCLKREGKTWLSLTGGFDSRSLAAIVHNNGLPFKSYTHGQPDAKDVHIANLISQKMDWNHQYFPLPEDWGYQRSQWLPQTLGQSDAHLGVLKTSRIIREQSIKAQQYGVSLWGFGGETYRGYYWKQEFFDIGLTTKVNYERLLDYRFGPPKTLPILKDDIYWSGLVREEMKTRLVKIGEQQDDLLNTVKLDLIGSYYEHTWSGVHISAVLGLQRAIAPFDFKESVASILSVNHKWRTHSRLFRLMLERTNPILANIETADGGPAVPIRLTNLHKFVPYWLNVSEKLAWGVTRKFLKRKLWRKRDAGPAGTAYPVTQWRRETLSQFEDEDLLTPVKMHSANLYDSDELQTFLAQAQTDSFSHDSLLSRVITVEMALRSVGTSF